MADLPLSNLIASGINDADLMPGQWASAGHEPQRRADAQHAPLASLDRFKQESMWRVARNAHESPDRRLQVCEHRAHYGDNIPLARFTLKFFE